MKYLYIYFIIVYISFGTYSCKKDYDLPDSLIQSEDSFVPEFYVRGVIVDLINSETIPFNLVTEEIDLTPILPEDNSAVFSNTDYSIQENTETILVSSYTGLSRNFSNALSCNTTIPTFRGISVQIISDVSSSNLSSVSLTETQLFNLLNEKKSFSFGLEPGQVDISFHHSPIDQFVEPFEDIGYYGRSKFSVDLEQSTFEVLNIERYQQSGAQKPTRGFLVHARINCSLGDFFLGELMNLVDTEAIFFFEYDL